MFEFSAPPPLGLYVHIPWCVRKCPYCDFNSHEIRQGMPERAYVDALLADLEMECGSIGGRVIESVFIGGGTPSLLTAESVERLLTGIGCRAMLAEDVEISLEANPGTVEQARFSELHDAGINRLSLGIQSFSDECLQRLGRIHGVDEALRAIASAQAAGFNNLNIDLMFGLPGQSASDAIADLRQAIALAPAHLSWYQLTMEPNTRFFLEPPELPGEETVWEIQQEGQALLAEYDYLPYEVSAYAREGRYCRHNLNYWQFGDYLGIGAGAHGKVTDCLRHTITRRRKVRHPRHYLGADNAAEMIAAQNFPTPADTVFEFMLNALRLTDGFAVRLFEQMTGLSFESAMPTVELARERGLLDTGSNAASTDVERVKPTVLGRGFLNDLVAMFLPETRSNAEQRFG